MDRPYRGFGQATALDVGLYSAYNQIKRIAPPGALDDYSRGYVDAFAEFDRPRLVFPGLITRPGEPIFTGQVVVLIDAACASACEDFALPFKSSGRARLIGEATSGSTGQPFMFDFGNGMSFRVSARRVYMPDGSQFEGEGIPPDEDVRPTLEDLRSGHDPVLERARDRKFKRCFRVRRSVGPDGGRIKGGGWVGATEQPAWRQGAGAMAGRAGRQQSRGFAGASGGCRPHCERPDLEGWTRLRRQAPPSGSTLSRSGTGSGSVGSKAGVWSSSRSGSGSKPRSACGALKSVGVVGLEVRRLMEADGAVVLGEEAVEDHEVEVEVVVGAAPKRWRKETAPSRASAAAPGLVRRSAGQKGVEALAFPRRWARQVAFIPVIAGWAAVVVFLFPPLFAFD